MKVVETGLPGCRVIEPELFVDERGFFFEAWNSDRFATAGIKDMFVQSNVSSSARGVLRGLHYQWPNPQAKLLSVLEGEVYDVAVDVRLGSPNFGQSVGVVLSSDNRRQLWIPEGFAHGFVVLSERALVNYFCTSHYDPGADATVRWDDPTISIDWPVSEPLLSPKDSAAPFLKDIEAGGLPPYLG